MRIADVMLSTSIFIQFAFVLQNLLSDCFVDCGWIALYQCLWNAIFQTSFEHILGFCSINIHNRYLKITKFFDVFLEISFVFQYPQYHSWRLHKVHFLKILQKYFLHFTPQNGTNSFWEHWYSCRVPCESLICKRIFHRHCNDR